MYQWQNSAPSSLTDSREIEGDSLNSLIFVQTAANDKVNGLGPRNRERLGST